MTKKQALIQFLIAMIVAVIFITSTIKLRKIEVTDRLFLPDFDANKVAKIVITDAFNQAEIAGSENGWVVSNRDNYPANFEAVRQFLRIIENVKIIRKPEVGLSQMGRLRLLDPAKHKDKSGTTITLLDENSKTINSFIIGKQHLRKLEDGQYTTGGHAPTGVYVRTDAEGEDVLLLDSPFAGVSAEASKWLDKSFVKMGVIQSIKVKFQEPENSWELRSEDDKGNMKLQGLKEDEKASLSKISSLVKFFPTPEFVDVVTDKEILKHLSFEHEIEISDIDGFQYSFQFGNEIDDTTVCRLKTTLCKPEQKLVEKLGKYKAYSNWNYQIPTTLIQAFKFKKSELIKKVQKTEKTPEAKK